MTIIKLKAPDGVDTVSFGSEVYEVEGGVVVVPKEAAQHLYQYGFSNHQDLPEEKPKRTTKQTAGND